MVHYGKIMKVTLRTLLLRFTFTIYVLVFSFLTVYFTKEKIHAVMQIELVLFLFKTMLIKLITFTNHKTAQQLMSTLRLRVSGTHYNQYFIGNNILNEQLIFEIQLPENNGTCNSNIRIVTDDKINLELFLL